MDKVVYALNKKVKVQYTDFFYIVYQMSMYYDYLYNDNDCRLVIKISRCKKYSNVQFTFYELH